jgi:hypothetical protein
MSSLYFICLHFIAENDKFKLFFKKYYINALNDISRVNNYTARYSINEMT